MKSYVPAVLISLLIHSAMALGVWTVVAHAPRPADSVFVAIDLALLPTLVEIEPGAAPVAVTPAPPAPPVVAAPPEPPSAVAAPAPEPVAPVAVAPPPPAPLAPPAFSPAASVSTSAVPAAAPAPLTIAEARGTGTAKGAGPAGAGNGPELGATAMAAQDFGALMSRLRQHVAYPRRARQMRWEGKVVVAFRLTREGEAEDIHVVASSGHDLLDSSAVAAVREASPFAPPARDTELILPVVYALK